jgi:rhamnogalacturonyl hydrolase YesR
MSWTTLLMLRWYEELEKDERLIEYATNYGNALLKLQDEKGYFPAWLDKDTLKPLEILKDSPETSMSVTFLVKLYEITGEQKYLATALKAMNVVMDEIIPTGRWEDFETYWSCCTYGNTSLVGRKVQRNNMYKQCNFSMFWTAEALLACYKVTEDKKYLSAGERCLDEMLMTQASWQPPYIYVEALGGFGVMNCDGEWNDSRQSLFAEIILQYGLELDRAS